MSGVGNGTMEKNTSKKQETDSSLTGVFEIPGEPAIIINGVPDILPSHEISAPCTTTVVSQPDNNKGFGEWLEGREVRKLFGGHYYSGTLTEYDKESGWYRVVYEDGDLEDLDWHELQEVLLPLDIMVPLKTLALKTIRRSKKPVLTTGTNVVRSRTYPAKSMANRGKRLSGLDGAL
ncbi:hypothetical protein UlMin_005946 [Ulmus minor]